MKPTKFHEWKVTHSGWILFAPILLAELDEDAPVPIPMRGLGWWYEINMWANDNIINVIVGIVKPEAVGYLFWGIKELDAPRIIQVPAIEPEGNCDEK